MKKINFIILLFTIITTFLGAKELEKVSLQLQWLEQFQFAGYFMAKEKGYYQRYGLDVEFKKFSNNINVVDEVVSQRATYGIGRSSLIIDKSEGKDIVLLEAIFQSSPSVFVALKDSNITSIKDFVGKKVMITNDVKDSVSLFGLLEHTKVGIKNIVQLKHTFNIDDLINKKTDLMSSYSSNEPFLLQERGIKYTIFDPKDYGFDFYSDILFTTSKEIKEHQDRTANFQQASIKGWEYAFEHINEAVNVIFQKYNPQHKSKKALLYEAQVLKKLAYYSNTALGSISKNKIQRIYDIYTFFGLVENKIDIKKLIYSDNLAIEFTQDEEEFINKHIPIKYGFYSNLKPLEWMGNDGEYKGVLSDFVKLIKERSGLNIIPINSQKADIFSNITKSDDSKEDLYLTTKKIISVPYVFVARSGEDYINGFKDLDNKKLGVLNNYVIENISKNKRSNFELLMLSNIEDAFDMLKNEEIDVIILPSIVAQYYINTRGRTNLKLAYKTKYKFDLKIAFNKDVPKEVISIIDEVLYSITEKEKSDIFYKWINIKIIRQANWEYVIDILLIGLFIVGLMFLYNRKLNIAIKNATKELEEKNNNFKFLLDNAQEIIIMSDMNYNIVDANLSTIQILEASSLEDIIGKNLFSFVDDTQIKKAKIALASAVQKPYEIKVKTLKNHELTVLASGQDIFLDEKKHRLSYFVDITKIKEMDYRLQQQSKLVQMGDMISMIAHQWRQPLNAISASSIHLSMLSSMEMLNDEKVQESSNYIQEQCQKMSKTINTFMKFVKPTGEKKEFKIIESLKSVEDIMGTQLVNHNIKVTIKEIDKDISIKGHEDLLEQVLINIFSNARDAFDGIKKEEKFIDITIHKQDNIPMISIVDNAGGIPEDIAQKIFNPYFTTKEQGKGTGVGLYMSLDIMRKSFHGDLVYSATDDGSEFNIILGEG